MDCQPDRYIHIWISLYRETDRGSVKIGKETEETVKQLKKKDKQEQKGERKAMQLLLSKNSF